MHEQGGGDVATDPKRTTLPDLARQTQDVLKLDGAAALRVEDIMKLQKDMVEQTGDFTRHWMERRREAAETGLEVLRAMSSANGTDPGAAMKAITDWSSGSFKRMQADLQEWVELCTQATQLATMAQTQAAPQHAGQHKVSGARRRTASGLNSNHATPV